MSSENTPTDVIESATKGATEGVLTWTWDFFKTIIQKFKDKDFSFAEDEEVITLAKEQRKKSEWDLFKNYVCDKDFRILFQMGLALRELEKGHKNFEPLKKKILHKYGRNGLYIAFFIQNGLFSKYVGNILDKGLTTEQVKIETTNLLTSIERNVAFINQYDQTNLKTEEIVTKIRAHSPDTFIISSVGMAIEKCEEIKEGVMRSIFCDYSPEIYEKENDKKKNIFFKQDRETALI